MSNGKENLEKAKIIYELEKKLGREVTDKEIRYVLRIPKSKGTVIRTRKGLAPKGTMDPETGQPLKDLDEDD